MDTTKLIEEADRLAHELSTSKFSDRRYYGTQFAALAAALRETAARAEAAEFDSATVRAGIKVAEMTTLAEVMSKHARALAAVSRVTEERDDLAAANLAANKRIEALEHERDAACAELARLTTPRPIAEALKDSRTQIVALWMDGNEIESMDVVIWADMDDGEHPERKFWMNMAGDSVEHMTHFLPLPVLP